MLSSTYSWAFDGIGASVGAAIYDWFVPYNSFLVGFFWMGLGMMMADREAAARAVPRVRALIAFAIGFVTVYGEWIVLKKALDVPMAATDVMLLLPLAAVPLFVVLMNWGVTTAHARDLRRASTVMYCLHATIARMATYVFTLLNVPLTGLWTFATVLVICALAVGAVKHLRGIPGFRWLRNAC